MTKEFVYLAKDKKDYDVILDYDAYSEFEDSFIDIQGLTIYDPMGLEITAETNIRIFREIKTYVDRLILEEDDSA